MGKKKRSNQLLLLVGAGILIILYMVYISYYHSIMEQAGIKDDEPAGSYKYQFDMIVDRPNSAFWQAAYGSALNTAEDNEILLEIKGPDWETEYDKNDFMNMSIAAQVNGIIVEYNGEAGLEEKINEAVENGIPVVTVMSDAPKSQRQSFVGVSDYQMGTEYGRQVASLVDGNTREILVLIKRNLDDMNQSMIYTQINNAALKKAGQGQRIEVKGRNLLSGGLFDTEEAIRDIFQQEGGPPDILVCMDEETTESAYQAMIDFNMAGDVKIIGYYTSKNIIGAVKKELIPVTCNVDTSQLGIYSVQALSEYLEEGRASSYYRVDVNFVTKDNVE
ncbi:MAG: substrate-binding domain-containing protein [Eubacteriales bacterium]|nr:substrate-binding domain-containing protein [Eubacteriales bacterium]